MITQEQVDRAYYEAEIEPRHGGFFFLDEDGEVFAGCALGALAIAHEVIRSHSLFDVIGLQPFTGYDRMELGQFALGFDSGMQGWPYPPFGTSKAVVNGYEIGRQKSLDLEESGEPSEAELAEMALA